MAVKTATTKRNISCHLMRQKYKKKPNRKKKYIFAAPAGFCLLVFAGLANEAKRESKAKTAVTKTSPRCRPIFFLRTKRSERAKRKRQRGRHLLYIMAFYRGGGFGRGPHDKNIMLSRFTLASFSISSSRQQPQKMCFAPAKLIFCKSKLSHV